MEGFCRAGHIIIDVASYKIYYYGSYMFSYDLTYSYISASTGSSQNSFNNMRMHVATYKYYSLPLNLIDNVINLLHRSTSFTG